MHTRVTDSDTRATNAGGGLGATAKQVAEHASALARLEMELAGLELKRKVIALGLGAALAIAGAIFLLYALGFGLAAAAAALGTQMSGWAALLIVTAALLVLGAVLLVLALGRFKRGTPPVPEQAIAEAKRTTAALKSNGRG
jgi:Putative Actinobacterial Holin-X, holin superfamily III